MKFNRTPPTEHRVLAHSQYILYKQQDDAHNARCRWRQLKYSLWVSWGIGRSDHYVQQDYIQEVPGILHENLQHEAHKHYGLPTSDTRLQLLRKQTNTDTTTALTAETHWSTAHHFAHSPSLWHQPRLANVTCAWSWRLCRTTPAILTAKIVKVTSVNCNFELNPVRRFRIWTRMFLYSHSWSHRSYIKHSKILPRKSTLPVKNNVSAINKTGDNERQITIPKSSLPVAPDTLHCREFYSTSNGLQKTRSENVWSSLQGCSS